MRRYTPTMILLHWTMAGLILAAYLTSEGGPHVRANPPLLHFWLGLSVIILLVPRLVLRFAGGAPRAENPEGWLSIAAKAGHWILYGLILFLPLSGWFAASRLGVSISFLGIELPSIATAVSGPPGSIAELHQLGGNLILILAAVHALVALWHQFALNDGTLSSMIPWLSAGSGLRAAPHDPSMSLSGTTEDRSRSGKPLEHLR